jgi:hypothetical protein
MLKINKTIVREKRKHTITEGEHIVSVYYGKNFFGLATKEEIDHDTTEKKQVYHYTIENEETGQLFSLKATENDIEIGDILYIGEKNNRIVTYSKNNIDESADNQVKSEKIKVVNSLKRLGTKDIIIAILAFIGFLTPVVSTLMNFKLAFKHDFKATKENYPEVNIKMVKLICAICGFMPIFFTVKLMITHSMLSLHTFTSSTITWGFISALVVVGGSIYIQSTKEKDIENFTNKMK